MTNSTTRRVLTAMTLGALTLTTHSAQAQITEGGFYNDFRAYFEASNTSSGREDTGWFLNASGEYDSDNIPSNSTLQYVLKKGERELSRLSCDRTRVQTRAGGYQIPEGQLGNMSTSDCSNRTQLLTEVGDMTIEVYVVNGLDDTRTLVRTHAIQVRRFTRVAAASRYYIVHNGELASSVIHECTSDLCMQGMQRNSEDSLGIVYWAAPLEHNGVDTEQSAHSGMTPNNSDVQLRCSVDGTRLDIGAKPSTRGVRGRELSDRYSTGEGRQGERFDYTFQQLQTILPISLEAEGGMPPGWVRLSEHSGAWECSLRLQGNDFRTFRFQAANGHIVPTHPEEVAAGVHFRPYVHLLDMSVASDSSVETRITNVDAARGPFFGVGWESEGGRAVAAAFSEPEMLAEWGVEGRRVVEAAFSWEERTAEVLALYETVLAER